jgi:hypothetical protein
LIFKSKRNFVDFLVNILTLLTFSKKCKSKKNHGAKLGYDTFINFYHYLYDFFLFYYLIIFFYCFCLFSKERNLLDFNKLDTLMHQFIGSSSRYIIQNSPNKILTNIIIIVIINLKLFLKKKI